MLAPRSGSVALTRRLVIQRACGRVVVYGADSPHTAEKPFVIPFATVCDAAAVVNWMKSVATKGWGATPADLLTLAQVLLDYVEERAPLACNLRPPSSRTDGGDRG